MKTIMITITENNNTFSGKKEIYNFCISKNGQPDSIEQNIYSMLKDMNNRGYINFNKLFNLLKYDNSIAFSNIAMNIKEPIINLSDNLEFIKNKLSSKNVKELAYVESI